MCQSSKIEHVVLIVQENHTFDAYFGLYCQAPAGSRPSCTTGRSCCEGAPTTEPHGASPGILDDASNFASDRDHDQVCELQELDGGAMDKFVSGGTGASTCLGVGPSCSSALNWVLASGQVATDPVAYYWTLADRSALGDRYFQPIAGGTASNDMYFAGAHYRFTDNAKMPDVLVGTRPSSTQLCVDPLGCIATQRTTYTHETIAGLLLAGNRTFRVYADGYAEAFAAATSGTCAAAAAAAECPYKDCVMHPAACFACLYDPSDIPFLYYQQFADVRAPAGVQPTPYVKDYTELGQDLLAGTLPSFAYVKARAFHNEHPNFSTIRDGVTFVQQTVNLILNSPAYDNNTLILVTWDEGGGFFDHVAPPAAPPQAVDADDQGRPVPYGTRVPLLAMGPFAQIGRVSHVTMEHSSIVKFLEYNFLTQVGQLQARDGWVNNIGSLLDPIKTGIAIPEN
jgi:phospholipase C